MNIAIDGRTIIHTRSGVGSYAERLVRSLLQYDHDNMYHLFLVEPNEHLSAPNLIKTVLPGYNRKIINRLWENVILPKALREKKIDVFFSPAYALPFLPRMGKRLRHLPLPPLWKEVFNPNHVPRYVVTIHDVIFAHSPQFFTAKMRMWQQLFVTNAARVAHRIIADSHATKSDLMNYFGVSEDRITVIYPELDEAFRVMKNRRELEAIRSMYGLPKRFILYVGTIEPRKNISGLLHAYASLPKQIRKEYGLVIAGAIGWYAEKIVEEIQALQKNHEVVLLGYFPHDHLPALYNLADLFVFPSFSEGFGYPPLEAMACGVPVICSDRPSLPEVVGNAARMVDPDDRNGLTSAMHEVLTKPAKARLMRRRGLARVRQYGWRKCAKETLKVLSEAMDMKL